MSYKRIISLFLTVIMVIGMISVPVYAEDEIKVLLDGEKLVFDVPPQIIDGRTMVPMRAIFEAFGAEVLWNGDTKTVTATKDEIVVIMQIDNRVITVSGVDITLDVPPQLIDGRTLVPARAVAESLQAKVDWDGATRTVIITRAEDLPMITPIDLDKQTEFVCNVGATLTYGFDDIWNRTVGTDYIPYITMVDSAYVGQVVLISPLYANFAIDDNGYAKVTYTIKRKKPNGNDEIIGQDIVAIDGQAMPKQIIKSMTHLEYSIDETDPVGTYTFTIESKDVVGNKTTQNVFTVNFKEYTYVKNEFKSVEELAEFVCNYAQNPNPDRVIDAIIYAEKNELITYPILFTGFIEMLAKNPYLAEAAVNEFEKEFGKGGTQTLLLVENTAAEYYKTIKASNPPTMTQVAVTNDINGDIMMYGNAIGAYFTGASYDAARVLIQSLKQGEFSEEKMNEYGVPAVQTLVDNDLLFRAYCEHMLHYDDSTDSQMKEALSKLLQ